MRPTSLPTDTTIPADATRVRPGNRSDHLLALVRDAAIISWTLDADGTLADGGEWIRFTGQTRSQTVGDGWLAVVHPDDRDRTRAAWREALDQSGHFNTDCRIRAESGTYRWFNIRATPVRGRADAVDRWVGVCLEIPGTWRFGEGPGAVPAADIRSATIDAPIIRAARAMLDWSAADLSDRSGVSVSTIRRLENDASEIQSRRTSTARLLSVFQRAGLRFLDQDGIIFGVGWVEPATAQD